MPILNFLLNREMLLWAKIMMIGVGKFPQRSYYLLLADVFISMANSQSLTFSPGTHTTHRANECCNQHWGNHSWRLTAFWHFPYFKIVYNSVFCNNINRNNINGWWRRSFMWLQHGHHRTNQRSFHFTTSTFLSFSHFRTSDVSSPFCCCFF